ncbi:MAG: flagellar filament capping protein FliD [Eubacterium sp.]|jgi:Flagellar capping protein|nr:flagellar filament capping protein FliD [Eubacterium sp.]
MSAISTFYSDYLNTYGPPPVSRYDSHKRSELRMVWNNIVKLNKESPLYKIKSGRNDMQKFVLDLKESARGIKNVVASLSTNDEGLEDAFEKKVAYSSQKDLISASYIGENANRSSTDSFKVIVNQLAKPQINMGNYLPADISDLPSGSFTFDLSTPANAYEFQFSINPGDTNRKIQTKLASLIQNANIGLNAEVKEDGENTSLQITSAQTGLTPGEEEIFRISARPGTPSADVLDTLGIDSVTQNAQNSSFLLNGQERTSYSNTFTINREFEITLNGVSPPGEETTVGFKTNVDAITDNIQTLVDSYNSVIQLADNYSNSVQKSQYLRQDMAGSARAYQNELESIGLQVNENGSIRMDKALLTDAIAAPNAKDELFTILNNFKDSLNQKATEASLNPMKYVNKVIVVYKNPGRNFATPYISSIYSGMMLDLYY